MLIKDDIQCIREEGRTILASSLKLLENSVDKALMYMIQNYKAYHYYSSIKKINQNMISNINLLYDVESKKDIVNGVGFYTRRIDTEIAFIKIFIDSSIDLDFYCEITDHQYSYQSNPLENCFGLFFDNLEPYNRSITNLKLKYKMKSNNIGEINRFYLNHVIGIDNERVQIL